MIWQWCTIWARNLANFYHAPSPINGIGPYWIFEALLKISRILKHIVQRRKEAVDNYLVPELQVDNYTDDHGKKVKQKNWTTMTVPMKRIGDNDTSDSDTDSDDIDSDDASQKQVLAHLENDPKAKTLFQENLADAVEVQRCTQFVKVTKTEYLPTLLKIGSTFFKSC